MPSRLTVAWIGVLLIAIFVVVDPPVVVKLKLAEVDELLVAFVEMTA